METVTIEKLQEFGTVYDAIEWASKQHGEYIPKPSKPTLRSNASSEEARKYAADLEQYEKEMNSWKTENDIRNKISNDISAVIVDFIKEESGLNRIPKQYQDKVYYFAYSEGHSYGYHEVYSKLVDLVDIFN